MVEGAKGGRVKFTSSEESEHLHNNTARVAGDDNITIPTTNTEQRDPTVLNVC